MTFRTGVSRVGQVTAVDRLTVGRGAETAALIRALDDLVTGRGSLAWIEGDPGIGKSRLVAELGERATRRGCSLLVGHADQLMQTFPLRVVTAAMSVTTWSEDPVRAQIARLLSGEADGELRYADPVLAAAERLLDLVEKLCADSPLVLVLEDAHWADEASLAFAERLSRVVDQFPLLLVLTCRPVPDGPPSRDAVRARAATRLRLAPLRAADVAALARAHLDGSAGPRLSALLDTATGSPLYVREILRSLAGADLTRLADGSVELGTAEPVPGTLADAVGRRLGMLSPEHLRALRLAAFLGDAVHPDDLDLVLERDARGALAAATVAGVLEPAGDRLRFRHELIRQVLLAQTPPALHGSMHDHIARVLAAARRPDTVVAGHLTAAADPLLSWALDWLGQRPESALYAAPTAYADLLRRAVAAVAAPDARRPVLVRQLMLVSFWLGRDDVVIGLGAAAIAAAGDPDLAARLRIQVMRSYARLRRFADAVAVLAPSLTDAGTAPVWRARAAAWSANAQAFLGEAEQARSVALAALALAGSVGDPLGIAYAHSALAVVDGSDQLVAHLEEGMAALGDDPESLDQRLLMAGNRAAQMGALGLPETEAAFDEALVTAERVGTYRTSTMHAHAAGYFFDRGRWDEALLHIEQLDTAALRHPAFGYLLGMRAVIAYRRGELAVGGRYLLAAGVPDPGPDGVPEPVGPLLTEAAALRAESTGNNRQALRIRSQYLDLPAGPSRDGRSAEAPYLIRLARSLGDESVARAALDVVAATTTTPTADGRLTIEVCRAVLAADAARLLGLAGEFRAGGWRLYAAFALEEAAAVLAATGDTAGARDPFRQATDLYAEYGAEWDLRRAGARFRPHGLRRGTRAQPRAAGTGWAALTATELRVSRLVAQGLANGEIAGELMLSRNTVQTHVSNVLTKLGRRSRTELARDVALYERGGQLPGQRGADVRTGSQPGAGA